jgi:predicted transposase YdaD
MKKGREEGGKIGLEKGRAEGKKNGIKEGQELGAVQKAIQTAKALKKKGIDVKVIAEVSKLSISHQATFRIIDILIKHPIVIVDIALKQAYIRLKY